MFTGPQYGVGNRRSFQTPVQNFMKFRINFLIFSRPLHMKENHPETHSCLQAA